MSLITRCPACETMFRVESGQLLVSEGWVRCGRCHEAFNAHNHLINLPDVTVSELPLEQAVKAVKPDTPMQVTSEPMPTGSDAALFDLAAHKPGWMDRPLARGVLMALGSLLGAILLLQVLIQERDRIIAQVPSVRQGFESLCQTLGCVAPLARQIESVLIDEAAFNRLDGSVYQLSFTLRNAASVDLALPALELTLTDSRGETLVRRAFRPRELQTGVRALSARSELNGKLILNIDLPAEAAGPAGYRLVAFYL